MDIGTLTGSIALEDQMSSALNLVSMQVSKFADRFEGTFAAVAITAGVAAVAIGGVTAAVTALGVRGASVQDVSDTLDQFAGSAENAAAIMANLRRGTRDTIDDFELLQASSRILAAGVKLTADQFGTLGEAAFVLQDRGLGTTKEMLDLVSSSLVTGRTRALAMKLGVIDIGDAEANFAKTLGVTKTQLSDTGKAEAHRIAVMELLNQASLSAAGIQRDFGDIIEQAKTKVLNWTDALAQQVAKSPRVLAAIDGIGAALKEAFGGSSEAAIRKIMNGINAFADGVKTAAPYIVTMKNAVVGLFGFLSDHADLLKTLAVGVIAYGVAWQAMTIGSSIVTGVLAGIKAIQVAAVALEASALVGLITPIGAIAAAVAGLAIAVYKFKTQMDSLTDKKPSKAFSEGAKSAEEMTRQAKALADAAPPLVAGTTSVSIGLDKLAEHGAGAGKSFVDLGDESVTMAKALREASLQLRDVDTFIGPQLSERMQKVADKIEEVQSGTATLNTAVLPLNDTLKIETERWLKVHNELIKIERVGVPVGAVMRALSGELDNLGESVSNVKIKEMADEWKFVGPVMEDLRLKSDGLGIDLDALANSMTQLAQVSGDSFGGVARAIAQVVVAYKTAVEAAKAYEAAVKAGTSTMAAGLGLFGVWAIGITTLADALTAGSRATGNYIDQWRAMVDAFEGPFMDARTRAGEGLKLLEEQAAHAGISLERFHAALDMPMSNTKESLAALFEMKLAIDEINDAFARQHELDDAIRNAGFTSTADLEALAKTAKMVYEEMLRQGTFTAEQLAEAMRRSAQAQALALQDPAAIAQDMAEKAGYKTREQLEQVASDAQKTYEFLRDSGEYTAAEIKRAHDAAIDAQNDAFGTATKTMKELDAEYKRLADSIADEAPERVMGVIEKRTRGEMAALEQQSDRQTKQLELDAKQAVDALERALNSVELPPKHVEVIYDFPDLPPGSTIHGDAPSTPASGGAFTAARPSGGGTAVLKVDRKVFARMIVPSIPGAVSEYGIG